MQKKSIKVVFSLFFSFKHLTAWTSWNWRLNPRPVNAQTVDLGGHISFSIQPACAAGICFAFFCTREDRSLCKECCTVRNLPSEATCTLSSPRRALSVIHVGSIRHRKFLVVRACLPVSDRKRTEEERGRLSK